MKTLIKNKNQLISVFKKITEEEYEKGFVLTIDSVEKYKTDKQNKTFHSLLNAFFDSGCSSFDNIVDLKNNYKEQMGMEVEYYVYFLANEIEEANKKHKFPHSHKVLNRQDIPKKGVVAINKVFQSFAQATAKQVTYGIKTIIRDIFESGAESDLKIQEILKGLGEFLPGYSLIDNVTSLFPDAKIIN